MALKTEYPPTAKGMCELHADAIEQLGPPPGTIGAESIEGWLLPRATEFEFEPLPDHYDRMEPKMCFQNAFRLATSGVELDYYEGFLHLGGAIPVLIHHAWCVEDGRLVDPTLSGPEDYANATYFGIHVPLTVLCKVTFMSETYSVLMKEGAKELLEEAEAR